VSVKLTFIGVGSDAQLLELPASPVVSEVALVLTKNPGDSHALDGGGKGAKVELDSIGARGSDGSGGAGGVGNRLESALGLGSGLGLAVFDGGDGGCEGGGGEGGGGEGGKGG
jgi:hypothetical protein